MRDRVKLNLGEELKHESSRTKGFMGEEDTEEYSVLNSEGFVVGKVTYTNHTAVKGFKITRTLFQTDSTGKVIVDERW